eukprot:6010432-Amphidinium_carterae.1
MRTVLLPLQSLGFMVVAEVNVRRMDSYCLTELDCGVVLATLGQSRETPPRLLLSFNSLILPYWIDIICQRMACYTITSCELNQLALNLIVLVCCVFISTES